MTAASNPGPGYRDKPDHKVDLQPGPPRVRVYWDDVLLADSRITIALQETGYDTVYYFPATDINAELFRSSVHRTYCPFKGEAHYRSLELGGAQIDNAVWFYPAPYDEVAALQDHFAFWGDRGFSFRFN